MKNTYLICPGVLAQGAGFRFATLLEAMEVLSGNTGQGMSSLCSPLALLDLISTSQKDVNTLA